MGSLLLRPVGIASSIIVLAGGLPEAVFSQSTALRAGSPQPIGRGVELTHVGAAALGPGGLLAVAQPSDAVVLMFSLARPDRPIKVLGRRGEGPGEFRTPGLLGWRADTLWVADWGRPRFEYFVAPEWSITSRVVGLPPVRGQGWRFRAPIGLLSDSTVLHYPSVTPAQLPKVGSAMPVMLTMPDGKTGDTIAVLSPGLQHFCVSGDRNGGLAASCSGQPITAENFIASGDNGARVLLVLQSALGVDTRSPVVRVVGADRRVVFERSLSLPLRAVTSREWDSVLTVWSRSFSQDVWSTERLARRGLSEVLRKPATHPMIDQALLGRDGTVWIRDAQRAGDGHRWHVLNRDGTKYGEVTLPSNLRVLDADRAQVIGVTPDADGVETLLRIGIQR